MDPNQNTPPVAPVNTVPSEVAPPAALETPAPKGNSKALTWCLGILAVLGIAAATVFAILYFTNPASPSPAPTNPGTSTTDPTPTPTDTDEEVEITDVLLKKDLDEKLAILHATEQTSSPLVIEAGVHQEFVLYLDGDLSEVAKLSHLARSLKNYQREPSQSEKETIAEDFNYKTDEEGNLYAVIDVVIDADTVAEEYYKLYGEKLKHGSLNDSEFYCPQYLYDSKLNLYFQNSGCGGTSPYTGIYYKTKYTTDNNHAYVYVSAAVFDKENGNIYCEIDSFEDYRNIEPCSSSSDTDELGFYVLDQDSLNPDTMGKYRFIFNKADDGTYYFKEVEKL